MSRPRTLPVLLIAIVLVVGSALFFQKTSFGTGALWQVSRQGQWLLPLVTAGALIDSVNPCAISVLLLSVAFLFSVGKLRSNVLRLGGLYVLGLALVYFLIGLGLLKVLHLFSTPHFLAFIGAVLLIGLGVLNILSGLIPAFPLQIRLPQAVHHRMAGLMAQTSPVAAFALGGLVGLCEFPCTGGPYLAVMGLLRDSTTYLKGFGYLLYYNALFVLPLVLLLLLAGNPAVVERLQVWQATRRQRLRLGSGIAMVALGALILLL